VQLLLKMELWSCCWRWSSGAATEDEVEGVLQDYNGLTFCFSLLFVRPPVFFRPCSLVFPPGFCGALSVRSSPVLCGLSLAFIKPGNAMQLPLDNEATDRCCRRRIVGSWQGSGSWMKRFSLKRRRLNLKWIFPIYPLNFWHLAIGSLWKSLCFF
jgi:hypothetical protein